MITLDLPELTRSAALGLGAGISPGPTNVLVVHQTLKHDWFEGAKVAAAPLITDVPILCACALLVRALPDPARAVAWLSVAGALYLAVLAVGLWRGAASPLAAPAPAKAVGSLRMGIVANFLNPGPWLHWSTLGVPILLGPVAGRSMHLLAIALMILSVVAGKLLVAAAARAASRRTGVLLQVGVFRAASALLMAFAAQFAFAGLKVLIS